MTMYGNQGDMGGTPPMMDAPQMVAPQPTMFSPLDRWAYREYGKMADQLTPDELPELYSHIVKTSDNLIRYWKPRDDRMLNSQEFWETGVRHAEEKNRKISRKEQEGQNEEQEGELLELNDGYLTVDKITSMVAGANWGIDVAPARIGLEDVAQDIENMLVWAEEMLDRKYSLSLHSKLIRDEVHYAALRGWITGLVVPNPKDPYLPWTYVLEDPLFVYPRYAGDELLQVVHRYTVPVLEAQSTYDQPFDFLLEKDDDDEVEVICYYDTVYRATILTSGEIGSGDRALTDRTILQPLTRHGYVDLTGKPINPWIIVTPRGSPTRKFARFGQLGSRREAVALVGLDVLYPIKEIIINFERLLAMMLTEISKGVNPPRIIFYDGFNKPEELDLGVGATNWMILHAQDAKILESTAMKPDTQPILSIIQDRLQRGSIPSVLYGQAGFTLAGYAINLLSQGAQDVVQPLLTGIQRYRELRFQRMLEMYISIGYQFAGPLQFASTDPMTGIKYSSGKYINPGDILANGVKVDVKFDTITPRDAVPLITAGVAANQAGILPLYDAMKDYAGIKDPKAAMHRLAEGLNYQDPLVQKYLARKAGLESGNQELKEAVMAAIAEEQQMVQMKMAQNGGSAKAPPNMPGGQEGPGAEASPPANVNPITASTNQMANVSSALNVGNGGTPPNPLAQFLGMGM